MTRHGHANATSVLRVRLPCADRTAFVRHKYTERAREWVTGGLRGECIALANKFRSRTAAERMAFVQRAQAAKAAGLPSWKAMQREAAAHAKWGTQPTPPPEPNAGGKAPTRASAASCDEGAEGSAQCGVCDADVQGAAAPPPPPPGFDAAAAMRAGFANRQETTHGLTTEQLRETLAAAGVGVRMATAGDLW